jgi:hypothetical protein
MHYALEINYKSIAQSKKRNFTIWVISKIFPQSIHQKGAGYNFDNPYPARKMYPVADQFLEILFHERHASFLFETFSVWANVCFLEINDPQKSRTSRHLPMPD